MSEWANLTLEQKLVTPPVRKTTPYNPADPTTAHYFPQQLRYDMEWKVELSEQMELNTIYTAGKQDQPSQKARWEQMVREEKIKALATHGENK